MNSLELLHHGWLLVLAFTVAVSCVMVLRRPCRRLLGTERGFQLWLLPPLAMLASQLPHPGGMAPAMLPPLVFIVASAAGVLPATAEVQGRFGWHDAVVASWLFGMLAVALLSVLAQMRYRRRLQGAVALDVRHAQWPVWRSAYPDVGPALVGAWRPQIVLPVDFDQRYDANERVLVLAHEVVHAQRRDGWWALCAQVLIALYWFHPLAWWALRAFRHDQELACDAAVLRAHGNRRRSYATAMLKTQAAMLALPVGCAWSPRHPITERIAMLKQNQPVALRRRAGGFLIALLTVCTAGAVYAAGSPVPAGQQGATDHYTLKVDVAFDGKPAEMRFTQCVKPGEYISVNGVSSGVPAWQGRFAVMPAAKGQIEVRGELNGGTLHDTARPIVRTMPGQLATILIGARVAGKPGDMTAQGREQSMKIDITPSSGCRA